MEKRGSSLALPQRWKTLPRSFSMRRDQTQVAHKPGFIAFCYDPSTGSRAGTQSDKNHTRWDPRYHFVLSPLALLNVLYQGIRLVRQPGAGGL